MDNAKIHKRVPHGMVSEYTAMGWKIWKLEGRSALLYWPKEGTPP